MRGKVAISGDCKDLTRITPAYAGKSVFYGAKGVLLKDHPRLCGEKGIRETIIKGNTGSPPPMRGKEFDDGQRKTIGRITPAYAGKSFRTSSPVKQ